MTETSRGEVGVAESGNHRFLYEEHHWSEDSGDAPTYDLVFDAPRDLGIAVQRQGRMNEGPWGVDLELRTDEGAVPLDRAREWAHAILAAVALTERLGRAAPLGTVQP